MLILIDNGHGAETPGKRSPDGRLREWKWAREAARLLAAKLAARGIEARLLVPEDTDVPLRERVRRANAAAAELGRANVALVSIHVNAAGLGHSWLGARGWQACVGNNASAASKRLAACIAKRVEAAGYPVRKPRPGQAWWPQSLAVCRDTACPAVLAENLFMDNAEDCELLLQPQTTEALMEAHSAGVADYIAGL